MTLQRGVNELILERIDSTNKMTQTLLSDLKEFESDFAVSKTELNILRESFKGLSDIVRDGNGSASILTRLILIEQKIIIIDKWMESHMDIHTRSKSEISSLKDEIDDLEKKLEGIGKDVSVIKNNIDEIERKKRQSIDRELELQHDGKINAQKLKAEQQSAVIKFTVALLLAVLTLLSGYAINSCNNMKNEMRSMKTPH